MINKSVNTIKQKVIRPMKEFVFEQITESRCKHSLIENLDSTLKQSVNDLQNSKVNFHSLAKAAEEANISVELSKINTNIKQDVRNKLMLRLQTSIQEARDAEKEYLDKVVYTNNLKESYITSVSHILDFYQQMEIDFNKFIKEKMLSYQEEQKNYFSEMIKLTEQNIAVLEQVNPLNDINMMIENNQTYFLPPSRIEFVPYTPIVDKTMILKNVDMNNSKNHYSVTTSSQKQPQDKDKNKDRFGNPNTFINNVNINELINKVKTFSKSVFTSEISDCQNLHESKTFAEIRAFLNSLWDGRVPDDDEKKVFYKHIKDQRNRKYFLTCLSKFRTMGLFLLDNTAYEHIVEILRLVLDLSSIEKDYESVKFSIILSQTFYKAVNNITSFVNLEIEDIKKDVVIKQSQLDFNKNSFNNPDEDDLKKVSVSPKKEDSSQNININTMNNTISNVANSNTNQNQSKTLRNPYISPKMFVQTGIQDHECFKNVDIWKGVIKYSIKEEYCSKSGLSILDNNTINTYEKKNPVDNETLRYIAYGQLLSVGYNMLSFGFNKEVVFELTQKFVELYNIDSELEKMLYSHLAEFSEENEDHIKNTILETSLENVSSRIHELPDTKKEECFISSLCQEHLPHHTKRNSEMTNKSKDAYLSASHDSKNTEISGKDSDKAFNEINFDENYDKDCTKGIMVLDEEERIDK